MAVHAQTSSLKVMVKIWILPQFPVWKCVKCMQEVVSGGRVMVGLEKKKWKWLMKLLKSNQSIQNWKKKLVRRWLNYCTLLILGSHRSCSCLDHTQTPPSSYACAPQRYTPYERTIRAWKFPIHLWASDGKYQHCAVSSFLHLSRWGDTLGIRQLKQSLPPGIWQTTSAQGRNLRCLS